MEKENNHFLSVDVEDWYHSEYLRHFAKEKVPRIEKTIPLLLDILRKHNTTITFFTLGDIADKHPDVVKEISANGHEVASHCYSHTPLWNLNRKTFEEELRRTEKALRKATGKKVIGFRAPYYSIAKEQSWAIEILRKRNYCYDSSIFPMKTPLYGAPGAPLEPYKPSKDNIYIHNEKEKLREYPISVLRIGKINIPLAGGFYLRAFPYILTKSMIKLLQKQKRSINMIIHPWEIDCNIPRLDVPLKNRLISYYGIRKNLQKFENLIKTLKFKSFREDIKENGISKGNQKT